MKREEFIRHTGLAGAGLLLNKFSFAGNWQEFAMVRTAEEKRKFPFPHADPLYPPLHFL